MDTTHVLEKDLWWVMRTANVHRIWLKLQISIVNLGLCQTHCKQVPDFSRPSGSDVASLQFLPSGKYGLCFGYCFSGPLPLRSNKGQVTFLKPFPGVPSYLDYTQKLAKSILALKLSVTTYFHWVTTTVLEKLHQNILIHHVFGQSSSSLQKGMNRGQCEWSNDFLKILSP